MRKLLKNDTTIRVLSVLISVLLWMYVVGVNNPTVSVVLKGVPVQIITGERFDNSGLKVISYGNKSIDVKVEGRHSEVSKISANDVKVSIDVSNITKPGKYEKNILLETEANGIKFTNITSENTRVFADYVIAVNKDIEIKTEGAPKEGFSVGEVSSQDKQVLVRGPKSVIDNIKGADVVVDISGIDTNISKGYKVDIINKIGTQTDMSYVTTNITETVVDIKLIQTKTVDVNVVFEDIADAGDIEVSVVPSQITVTGDSAIIKTVEKINTTVIKKDDIKFDENTKSITLNVDYILPQGVSIAPEGIKKCEVVLTAK